MRIVKIHPSDSSPAINRASIRIAFFLFILLCLGRLPSLGAEDGGLEASDFFPAEGAENVPVSVSLQVRLSKPAAVDTLSYFALYRIEDGERAREVDTRPATDLTNASITIVPTRFLDPDAEYELSGDARVKAVDGSSLAPFTTRFRTGGGGPMPSDGLLFAAQTFDQSRSMTALAFGPDRRLYAADAFGSLVRWEIDENGTPFGKTTLLSDPDMSRQYIDLEWDPEATADDLVLWVSYGERVDYPEDRKFFTGTIAKLHLGERVREQIVVTGLPHGREKQGGFDTLPHQPNGLAFKDGFLYQSVGSTSSSGGPANWGISEQPLSASILEIDYRRIHSPLDVHPASGYDPSRPGAPLRLFATGIRNAVHLVAHSNGNLYTAVNMNDRKGSADGVPDHPELEGDQNLLITQTTPDHESLLLIRSGRHYGFPNPSRNQYVLMGGNPTSAADPFEIQDYPLGTPPDPGFAPELMYEIWQYGGTSANGMVEYAPENPHPLSKALIVCFYSTGDIAAMPLGEDGLPTRVEKLRGPTGKLPFTGPLDIAMDSSKGILYIADFGTQNKFGSDGSMVLLRPLYDGDA